MKVKCPKCRLRFDVTVPAGITEVQCNCPRCGTPFVYRVTESEKAQQAADRGGAEVVGGKPMDEPVGDLPSSSVSGGQAVPPPYHADRPTPPPYSPAAPAPQPPSPGIGSPTASPAATVEGGSIGRQVAIRRIGCFVKGVSGLVLLTVMALAIYGITGTGDESPSFGSGGGTVAPTKSTNAGEAPSVDARAEEGAPPTRFDAARGEEKVPTWIQGRWHVDTDYGGISLAIKDNTISETSEGGTSYGRFRYQNGALYCDFGDGKIFVYRLDMDGRRIDAGQGMLMRRVDE